MVLPFLKQFSIRKLYDWNKFRQYCRASFYYLCFAEQAKAIPDL
jgi:hypothetical protein